MYQLPLKIFGAVVAASSALALRPPFQPLPLSRDDRWIVDADDNHVPIVGINWPGAADTMLPEGLQYLNVTDIVNIISGTGFNAVRLTFAIEMVDDILDNGGDVSLNDTLTRALGQTNGTIILKKILHNNPEFSASTTRLQVIDTVARELAAQDIYLHYDNHVSKAMWCCDLGDGNSWFGDTYFNTTKWVRGLTYMAAHGKANWPTFSSMGLRNELRPSTTGASTLEPYTWTTWKTFMTEAASSIHAVNPDVLIYFSGVLSDFILEPAISGHTLLEPFWSFNISEYEWSHKLVWELHEYDEHISGSCDLYKTLLNSFGADATTTTSGNRGPLVISEWGHDENDTTKTYESDYSTCIAEFMVERQFGWMLWALGGSYYIRTGQQDSDEPWGILNHTWTGPRGVNSTAVIKAVIADTYGAYGQ